MDLRATAAAAAEENGASNGGSSSSTSHVGANVTAGNGGTQYSSSAPSTFNSFQQFQQQQQNSLDEPNSSRRSAFGNNGTTSNDQQRNQNTFKADAAGGDVSLTSRLNAFRLKDVGCDVAFVVGEEKEQLKAHKLVLGANFLPFLRNVLWAIRLGSNWHGNSTDCARISMLDELRHKNRIMEQQLRKQTLANKLLRDHLRTQRQRSTSLERSTSASQQRRVLANISNTPTGPNTQTRKLQVEKDLLFTLESGITFRAREALKRNFAGQNMDVWASTRAVKRLKKELAEGSSFAWTGEGESRALICTNIRAMLEGRLQATFPPAQPIRQPNRPCADRRQKRRWPSSNDKIGLIIGNVDQPNSPKNLSLLAIYFGHDDRKNLQARLCTVFEQVNELKMVSFVYEGRRWTVPTQLLLCADLKFTSALLGHQGAASTFPCPLCTARRGNLQDRIIGPRPSPPPSIDSYIAPPLVAIHLNDVVPPSFHLLHGNGQRLIDAICAEADDYDCGEEVRKRLKEAGVRRHPRTKQFTGKRLLAVCEISFLQGRTFSAYWTIQILAT
uniref:BTB domain-containing protein n=1 Tax=Globodera pallida TaxID=36090 RepID=A0A183CQH0_GLOPA